MSQVIRTPEQEQALQQDWQALSGYDPTGLGVDEEQRRAARAGFNLSTLASATEELSRRMQYDTDPSFDAQAFVIQEEQQRKQLGLSMFPPDQRESLLKSRSVEDYASRKDYLMQIQQWQSDIAASPVTGIGSMLLGDAPLLVATAAGNTLATAANVGRAATVAAETAGAIGRTAGTLLGETALLGYAVSQSNPNVTAADLIFASLGVGAVALHGMQTVNKAGRTFMVSSEDAAAVRSAGDAGSFNNPARQSDELDAPVTIRSGEQHVSYTKIDVPQGELKVRVSAGVGDGRTVVRSAADGSMFIDAKPVSTNVGRVATRVQDLLSAVPVEAVRAATTVINAAATPEVYSVLRKAVREALPETEVQRLGNWMQDDKAFILGLQDPAFARTVQRIDPTELDSLDMRHVVDYHAAADAKPNFASEQLREAGKDFTVRDAAKDQELKQNVIEKVLNYTGFSKHASLWDRVAYAGTKSRQLSDRLFSNASRSGARIDSASDYRRTLELQNQQPIQAIHNELENLVRAEGVSSTDRFLNSEKYSAALYKHADNITRFMQTQYQLERAGEPLLAVPEQYSELVNAIQGWSKSRRELMQQHGLEVPEAFSDWYLPVRYDFAETSAALTAKGIRSDDAVYQLMQKALADAYEGMPQELINKVARNFEDRVMHRGLSGEKRSLQELMDGTGDELEDVLREAGATPETIAALRAQSRADAAPLTQNLRSRTKLRTDVAYEVDGVELSLQDLMQKDFIASTRSYDEQLMGKLAMREAGFENSYQLDKAIRAAEAEVPVNDRIKWKQAIDDGVQAVLGITPNLTPDLVRGIGKYASATMLRNSGIYQAVDTGFAHMTFGSKNILKAMQPEQKALLEGLKDKQVYKALESVVDGVYLRDTKAAYLNRRIENTVNLTGMDRFVNVGSNFASATQTFNGMRMVQKAQQGLVGNLMRGNLWQLLNATGSELKGAQRIYKEIGGLTDAELQSIRSAGAESLPWSLQKRLDNAHSRILDTVVQQNRIGEYPHWTDWTNAGQILTGFAKFSLVAMNKVLRRLAQQHGAFKGPAMAALYTLPWMIAAQTFIAARDGKLTDKQGQVKYGDILAKSAGTLTVWGPGTSVIDALFGTGKVNIGNPGIDWGLSALAAPGKILSLDERAGSAIGRVVPMLGMVPGATGLLDYSFGVAAEARDAAVEDALE